MTPAYRLFVTAAILSSACNNSNEQSYQGQEQMQKTDTAFVNNTTNSIPRETIAFVDHSGFSTYAKSKLPDFDWSRFTHTRFWEQDSLQSRPFTPNSQYFTAYGRFLRYSPDSSRFIDLDSYNTGIRMNSHGQLIGNDQGPDTEISLVNVEKKRRSRLLFMGPGNTIEDGGWMDNNHVVLVGLQQDRQAGGTQVVMYSFDLLSGMVHMYEMKDADKAESLKGYSRKERLKGIIMEGR